MAEIVPTILSETPDDYKLQVQKIHPFARRVHIDITDGDFAPSFTINSSQIWWPEEWVIDIHAMVANPEQYVDKLIALKPSLIVFHAESSQNLLSVLQKIKQQNISAGVALLRSTVPADVADLIKVADHVMIFSGDLGKYGGKASMMQLEKVRLIKNINESVEIGWDGGVNIENAFTLSQGGIDVLNTGGAIQKAADSKAVYDELVKEINKRGVI
ncbi:MAG: hypothetical protein L0H36_00090 [bacterium]|nr:hypothetical protein [bacterium]